MTKRLKDMIKKNPEPAKVANVDPGQLGQYSATNQVSEDGSLNTFLSSRGINPKFVSRDTKISHAKSNEYKTWKKNHMFEETLIESALLDRYLSSRGINPKYLPTDKKIAYAKSNEFLTWKQSHMREDITTGREKGTDDTVRNTTSDSPTKSRADILKKAMKFHKVTTPPGSLKKEGSQTPELTPEAVQQTALKKFRDAAAEREKKHDEIKNKETKDGSGMSAAIDRLQKHMNKEEVEQIDELKKSTVKSWLGKQEVVPPKKPGMDRKAHNQRIKTRSKSWDSALDRLTGRKPTSEDVGDGKAAVNADGLPSPQLEPVSEKKKQMSKSARMIKALYKKKGMVKEDLHDHEKEDKSVATYGKKPKFEKAEKDDGGENKPSAAATLTGGKTLTGEKRDDVEIDPMMRVRPGQPDPFKKDDKKKDGKDGKKEEKK
jgi:hypothetical protein